MDIREKAASVAHDIWSEWIRHRFDNHWINNPTKQQFDWYDLAMTPFEKLTEEQRISDYEVSRRHIMPLIAELESELAALREVTRWVFVMPDYRYPEDGQDVLVKTLDGFVIAGSFDEFTNMVAVEPYGDSIAIEEIECWLPLPEA